MRKLKLLMLAFMATCGLGVNAADIVVGEKFTKIDDLDGKLFAVVDETTSKAMGIGVAGYTGSWDMYFGTYNEAYTSNACFYKIEAAQGSDVQGYYYLRTYNSAGNMYTAWKDASQFGYFNSQPGTGGYFALGLEGRNGQDALNHAVWEITESEGKFALKNIGTGKYLHADQLSNTYSDPFYFTFCTIVDLDELKAEYNTLKPLVEALDDDPTLFTGSASIDISAAETAFANASTGTDVKDAIAKLRQAAATFLGAVKVNEDKYFDITNIFLNNADFSNGTINGWETNYVSGQQAQNIGYQSNRPYSYNNVTLEKFIESWLPAANGNIGDGYLRQTVSNLPEGKYLLEADAIAVKQNNENLEVQGASLYIFADGIYYKTALNTLNEKPEHFSREFLNTGEGDVIFGLMTENANCNWICADNFKVKYYGIDLTAYEEQLANEVTTFEGYENNVDATVYAALKTHVDALNTTYNSSKAYAAAISKVQTINAYVAALIAANAAKDDATYANVTGTELTALNTAIADVPTYDDYSSIAEKTTALTTATSDFIAAASSYDAFATEKDHAERLGVTEFPAPTTAAEAATAVNTLKVSEHNAVISKYTTDGSALFIPSWDKENFDALSNEHWSGTTSEYFDKWSGSAYTSRIYKEVTLPEGHYVFYAAARGQANASTATLKVTIGDNTLSVPCTIKGNRGYGINTSGAADFSPSSTYACNNEGYGWEWRHIAFDLDAETPVTLAIECTGNNSWVSAGDTRLVTYDNIAVSMNRYQAALDAATTARDNAEYANITGSERTALENAINTTPTTREEYDAAADALEAALSVFKEAKANYNAYVAYKAETATLFGDEVANSVTAPNSAAECVTAIQNLNIAQYNKVENDYTYSLSGLIGDFGTWTGTATVHGEAAEPNYLDWEHWSGVRHAYYEQAANGWGDEHGWTIQYQKTCTLPAGEYVIKVAARASGGTQGTISCSATNTTIALPNFASPGRGINTSGVASWSDDDTFANGDITKPENAPSVGGKGTGWQWRFLPFTLTEQTAVTMTFYAEASTQYQWMSIADGELLSANNVATDVSYNDEATNTITDEDIANVTITRNIKVGYNTVVLPFTLTANQVAAAFGSGTEVYAYSENSDDADDATINFTKGDGSITANVPVLVKATQASTSQTFEGVQIVAPTNDVKVAGKFFDFVGTYAPINPIAAGDFFIGTSTGGESKLFKSAGETKLNAFRAYIHDKSSNTARITKFFIDGEETTAIEGIEIVRTNSGKIYNLNGQEVKNAGKGIFIQNGKKIVVK